MRHSRSAPGVGRPPPKRKTTVPPVRQHQHPRRQPRQQRLDLLLLRFTIRARPPSERRPRTQLHQRRQAYLRKGGATTRCPGRPESPPGSPSRPARSASTRRTPPGADRDTTPRASPGPPPASPGLPATPRTAPVPTGSAPAKIDDFPDTRRTASDDTQRRPSIRQRSTSRADTDRNSPSATTKYTIASAGSARCRRLPPTARCQRLAHRLDRVHLREHPRCSDSPTAAGHPAEPLVSWTSARPLRIFVSGGTAYSEYTIKATVLGLGWV